MPPTFFWVLCQCLVVSYFSYWREETVPYPGRSGSGFREGVSRRIKALAAVLAPSKTLSQRVLLGPTQIPQAVQRQRKAVDPSPTTR